MVGTISQNCALVLCLAIAAAGCAGQNPAEPAGGSAGEAVPEAAERHWPRADAPAEGGDPGAD